MSVSRTEGVASSSSSSAGVLSEGSAQSHESSSLGRGRNVSASSHTGGQAGSTMEGACAAGAQAKWDWALSDHAG